jgi:hypothetical protein
MRVRLACIVVAMLASTGCASWRVVCDPPVTLDDAAVSVDGSGDVSAIVSHRVCGLPVTVSATVVDGVTQVCVSPPVGRAVCEVIEN